MTITCGIQHTGVTMALKVLHNTCNICIHDLLDMYVLSPWAVAYICIRQIPHAHVTTITCNKQKWL